MTTWAADCERLHRKLLITPLRTLQPASRSPPWLVLTSLQPSVRAQMKEGMNQNSDVAVHRTLIISLAPAPYVFVLSLIELILGWEWLAYRLLTQYGEALEQSGMAACLPGRADWESLTALSLWHHSCPRYTSNTGWVMTIFVISCGLHLKLDWLQTLFSCRHRFSDYFLRASMESIHWFIKYFAKWFCTMSRT